MRTFYEQPPKEKEIWYGREATYETKVFTNSWATRFLQRQSVRFETPSRSSCFYSLGTFLRYQVDEWYRNDAFVILDCRLIRERIRSKRPSISVDVGKGWFICQFLPTLSRPRPQNSRLPTAYRPLSIFNFTPR